MSNLEFFLIWILVCTDMHQWGQ